MHLDVLFCSVLSCRIVSAKEGTPLASATKHAPKSEIYIYFSIIVCLGQLDYWAYMYDLAFLFLESETVACKTQNIVGTNHLRGALKLLLVQGYVEWMFSEANLPKLSVTPF